MDMELDHVEAFVAVFLSGAARAVVALLREA